MGIGTPCRFARTLRARRPWIFPSSPGSGNLARWRWGTVLAHVGRRHVTGADEARPSDSPILISIPTTCQRKTSRLRVQRAHRSGYTPTEPTAAAGRDRRRQVGWRTGDVLRAAGAVIAMYLLIRCSGSRRRSFSLRSSACCSDSRSRPASTGCGTRPPPARPDRGAHRARIGGRDRRLLRRVRPVLATQSRELKRSCRRRSTRSTRGFSSGRAGFSAR
jgi:hypothetical protein